MRYGLQDSVIQRICGVLARYPQVDKAVLYGSRAQGSYRKGSDIDLALYGGADLNLQALYRIMDEIDDLLLPYSIDLSVFTSITDADVIAHIERAGVTFYDRGGRCRMASIQSSSRE